MNNFAHLKTECPFYHLFPNGLVPIKDILLPSKAECIGDGVQDIYMVNLEKLSSAQFDGILDLLVAGTTFSREEARNDIERDGLPLRAKHVSGTSSDLPFFL
jgi:hypothetical protein